MSSNETIESFEVTKGKKSGDLLSEIRHDRKLKVGLLACGYFEYWRMYEGLREEVAQESIDVLSAVCRVAKRLRQELSYR